MSVLIRGMKMPKECRECYLLEYYEYLGETQCSVTRRMLAERGKPISFDGRPSWCPLVEVPEPHGRLIDAEKLKNEYPHDTDWDYPVNTNCYVCESIDNAPTVIEAEGE